MKPAKKYSDISGLEAPYTDPRTGLRYSSAAEQKLIRSAAPEAVEELLEFRSGRMKSDR